MADWVEKKVGQDKVDALLSRGLTRLMARILALREVSPETLDFYFNPSMFNLADPSDLPGIDIAVDSILAALRAGRKAVVFGDYDCDGISATAILVKTLRALSFDVEAFLPNRMTEGYGMNAKSVGRLLSERGDAGIVITVDNGINSVKEVEFLKSKGIDVIVTDHHLPGDVLPDCPVVNPKVAAPKELEHLCGAGVAFFLSNALMRRARSEGLYAGGKISPPLFVLAGLATVTDIMPIGGKNVQNRVLVSEALRLFKQHAPVGLIKLFELSQRSPANAITSRDFGFMLGPRINASGRMSDGMHALKLLLRDDPGEAMQLAARVDEFNKDRKGIEQEMLDDALKQVVKGAPAQVIVLENGHKGIVGIVASRVLEYLKEIGTQQVPVAVVVDGHGSLRAPEGYNVRDALLSSEDFLDRFGGHALAGGFSVKEGAMECFKARFLEACAAQSAVLESDAASCACIDSWVTPEELSGEFAESLLMMEPFGEGNPEPVLGMKNVAICDVRSFGEGRHLSFGIGAMPGLRCVWWRNGAREAVVKSSFRDGWDIMFVPVVSHYGGECHVELRILSVK